MRYSSFKCAKEWMKALWIHAMHYKRLERAIVPYDALGMGLTLYTIFL